MNSEKGATSRQNGDTGDDFQVDSELLENSSSKTVKKELRGVGWPVYKDYEIREEDSEAFVVAPISSRTFFETEPEEEKLVTDAEEREYVSRRFRGRSSLKDAMTFYAPLRTPEVALELAELAEEEITQEIVLDWAHVYGLLGFPDEDTVSVDEGYMKFNAKGQGRRGSVARFADAAGEVRTFLRIYEAITTDGEVDFKKLLKNLHPLPAKAHPFWIPRSSGDRAWFLNYLGNTAQIRLKDYCYAQLRPHVRGIYPTGEFTLSWGFEGLIGAVWLHMAWLLEAEGTRVKRCKLPDCRRVIHFDPGKPPPASNLKRDVRGKYKTRSDREFCKGRGCKQKYHYRKKAGWPNHP